MKIDKNILKYLADLARVEIKEEKHEKFFADIDKIIGYFGELENVDTDGIEPLAGGTIGKNIFREDELKKGKLETKNEKLIEAFPEKENNFLKVPAVFGGNEL